MASTIQLKEPPTSFVNLRTKQTLVSPGFFTELNQEIRECCIPPGGSDPAQEYLLSNGFSVSGTELAVLQKLTVSRRLSQCSPSPSQWVAENASKWADLQDQKLRLLQDLRSDRRRQREAARLAKLESIRQTIRAPRDKSLNEAHKTRFRVMRHLENRDSKFGPSGMPARKEVEIIRKYEHTPLQRAKKTAMSLLGQSSILTSPELPQKEKTRTPLTRSAAKAQKAQQDYQNLLMADLKVYDQRNRMSVKPETQPLKSPLSEKKKASLVADSLETLSADKTCLRTEASLIALQRVLRGRALQITMQEGCQKRAFLIQELRCSEGLPREDSEGVADLHQLDYDTAIVESAVAHEISAMLDTLSTEMRLCQEEKRVARLVSQAHKDRAQREALEIQKRRTEVHQRDINDAAIDSLIQVHRTSATSYLHHIFQTQLDRRCERLAQEALETRARQLNGVVDDWESQDAGQLASDLLKSFLLPYVDRESVVREVNRQKSRHPMVGAQVLEAALQPLKSEFTL